jgi:hypothetical protein
VPVVAVVVEPASEQNSEPSTPPLGSASHPHLGVCQLAEEASEHAAASVGTDRQHDLVQVDVQAEQRQRELVELQVEHGARPGCQRAEALWFSPAP